MVELKYDRKVWYGYDAQTLNTLQVFITSRCDRRCPGCFYADRLGRKDMPFEEYIRVVGDALGCIDRVTLLGGEPSLHRDLDRMVLFNRDHGLQTTIYTNGQNLPSLRTAAYLLGAKVRVGVHDFSLGPKPLMNVKAVDFPFTVVYMMNKFNGSYMLRAAAEYIDTELPTVEDFYLSSIRDIGTTGSFWRDTDQTISNREYAAEVQGFVNDYRGRMKRLHISTRGVLTVPGMTTRRHCRFINVHPDGSRTVCPLDIGKGITNRIKGFPDRLCNKSKACVLRKIVLQRI